MRTLRGLNCGRHDWRGQVQFDSLSRSDGKRGTNYVIIASCGNEVAFDEHELHIFPIESSPNYQIIRTLGVKHDPRSCARVESLFREGGGEAEDWDLESLKSMKASLATLAEGDALVVVAQVIPDRAQYSAHLFFEPGMLDPGHWPSREALWESLG